MKLSARNMLKGRIIEITEGIITAKVKLDVGGNMITSIISKESVHDLGLKVGDEAYAIVKATEVVIGK